MNLVKVGEWYFNLGWIQKAGPGESPGALKVHNLPGETTELVGQDASDMRAILDRYASVVAPAGIGPAMAGTDRDPATGTPNP